jgi:hypothetical protein
MVIIGYITTTIVALFLLWLFWQIVVHGIWFHYACLYGHYRVGFKLKWVWFIHPVRIWETIWYVASYEKTTYPTRGFIINGWRVYRYWEPQCQECFQTFEREEVPWDFEEVPDWVCPRCRYSHLREKERPAYTS